MRARKVGLAGRLPAAALAVGLGAGIAPAGAGCVSIWATKLGEAHDVTHRRTQFHLNDQFVLCIRLDQDAFVSIWDAPPHGDVARLFPNIITNRNDNGTVRAQRMSGGITHCFGTPETFPLFFPAEQGVGQGKLSVVATAALAHQPTLEDYAIPGQSMPRAKMEEVARNYRSAANCGDRVQEYVEYAIVR